MNVAPAGSAGSASLDVIVAVAPEEFRRAQLRRGASAGAVLAACALWYMALGRLHATTEGMPWYVTCGAVAVLCALAVVRGASRFTFGRVLSSREPLSLLETWALSYSLAALALFAWVVVHGLLPQEVPPRMVQVVDIQLSSERDFANRNSPMPGTVEKTEMHRRQSDKTTVQGDFGAKKEKPVVKKTVEQPKPIAERVRQEETREVPVSMKPSAFVVVPERPRADIKPQQHQPFVLEEVQPPEMVEMIENDGVADAEMVFQSGGASIGGNGAENELSVYIKELHRRIKNAWSPPRLKSREARILFRIRKDGRLSFIRVTHSSGDADTDAAALNAVARAVSAKKLPEDYALPYLDVQYTFRYTADELKEVTPRVIE